MNSAQCEWSSYAWAENFSFASEHMFDLPFPLSRFGNSQGINLRPGRSHYQSLTKDLLKYEQNDKVIELWAYKVILTSIFPLKYINIK